MVSIIRQADENIIRNIHLEKMFAAYKKMIDCLNAITEPVTAGNRTVYPSTEDQLAFIQDAEDALDDMIDQGIDLIEKLEEIRLST